MGDNDKIPDYDKMPVADIVKDLGDTAGKIVDTVDQVQHEIANIQGQIREGQIDRASKEINQKLPQSDIGGDTGGGGNDAPSTGNLNDIIQF